MLGNRKHEVGNLSEKYEWKSGSVQVAGVDATSKLNDWGSAPFNTIFDTVPVANHIKISSTGDAFIRLNNDSNDIITVDATTPFESDNISIWAIYVSTNDVLVTLTIELS